MSRKKPLPRNPLPSKPRLLVSPRGLTGKAALRRVSSFFRYGLLLNLFMTATNLAAAAPMTLTEYLALKGPEPTDRVAYGAAPSQYAEVFRPTGPGPFPVVVLVHGGCYLKEFAGIQQFRNIAGALATQGIAVWNVEYRRVDEPGGGYPGTYEDMIAALHALGANAAGYNIDVSRVVAVGHSAGGHLVQWTAGRSRIPASSPLYRSRFLPIREIVSLGGINDLSHWTDLCGFDLVKLTGSATPNRPNVLSDTSPAELLPNGSHTVLITGELDQQVPLSVATRFAGKARAAGDQIEILALPGASHFDEAAATSPSWITTLAVIKSSLGFPATK
jgi:acetyl esterase/lipase